jgi:hypothetical protein
LKSKELNERIKRKLRIRAAFPIEDLGHKAPEGKKSEQIALHPEQAHLRHFGCGGGRGQEPVFEELEIQHGLINPSLHYKECS